MVYALIVEGWMAQVLGLLVIAALLSVRPPSTANRLLAAGLFCTIYRQFVLTMQLSRMIAPSSILFPTSFLLQLLAIPMYYLYVRGLTTPKFSLERRDIVHLTPFAIGVVWYSAMWIGGNTRLFQSGLSYDLQRYVQVVVKVLVVIPYLVHVSRRVRAFAHQSKAHLSDLTHLKLRWLRTLLGVGYLIIGVDTLGVVTGPNIPVWRLVPPVGLISLMMLAYFSIRVSPVFAREAEWQERHSTSEMPAVEQKREPKRLSEEELEQQKERLIHVLESRTLYLNPELRLSDLAAALHIRPYRVSETLSRGLQTSFYDLINRYRITQAQKLLSSPASAYLNLLGVAMESGFKSKSVFNDVFKKATGMTPSEFRSGKMTESLHSDD